MSARCKPPIEYALAFIEVSSRASEVEFDEAKAAAGPNGDSQYRYYGRPSGLEYWSLDNDAGPLSHRVGHLSRPHAGRRSGPGRSVNSGSR